MTEGLRLPTDLEVRAAIELRTVGRRLEGMAAVYNVPAMLPGGVRETIRPGAFRAALAVGADVLALVDHDPGRLLARTRSGTLRLAEDALGLRFEIDVPPTTLGNDVLAMAERRDLGGMSFGFRVTDEAWPARDRREVRSVELIEISVVHAHPAYSGTTIAARSRLHLANPAASAMALRRRLAVL